MNTRHTFPLLTFIVFLSFPSAVFAHIGEGAVGGFIRGFLHPVFGFDHVIAMVAVGLWGALLVFTLTVSK